MENEKRFEFVQVSIVRNSQPVHEREYDYEVGKNYLAIKDRVAIEDGDAQPYGIVLPDANQEDMEAIVEAMDMANEEDFCGPLCVSYIKVDWVENYDVEVEEI